MTDNADLIKAYEFAAKRPSFLPSDLADEFGHNMRYSREIIGVLMGKKLAFLDSSGDMDCYKPTLPKDPATIREFGLKRLGLKEEAANMGETKASKPRAKVDHGEYHPCGCGCGESVPPKSNYRPGHDARHAGQVGREVAAIMDGGHDEGDQIKIDALYATLPSDLLKAKAQRIAEKANEKNLAKAQPEPVEIEGLVTVGKKEYAAIKLGDVVTRVDTGKPVSKAAAKTFEVA
jgi:hypothetical protein